MVAAENIEAGGAFEATEFVETSFVWARGDDDGGEDVVELAAAPTGFVAPDGEEKKEVIEALAFGFLVVLEATSAALRFSGVAMLGVII